MLVHLPNSRGLEGPQSVEVPVGAAPRVLGRQPPPPPLPPGASGQRLVVKTTDQRGRWVKLSTSTTTTSWGDGLATLGVAP